MVGASSIAVAATSVMAAAARAVVRDDLTVAVVAL
jgi:hypothetical protein